LSDPTAATPSPTASGPTRHQRKLSNFLLDKKLQLRYVVVITLLSAVIAGLLGVMIFDQRRQSTQSIEHDLQELVADQEDVANITADYERQDRNLVYKMVGIGAGLAVILSLFLVVMTHKVAGPLYKTSLYFDRMAEGRLGTVTPLRHGDMLQDFFAKFKEMHDAVRGRAVADVDAMEQAVTALREAGNRGDYRGEAWGKLAGELERLEAHVAERKQQLGDGRSA
jgi:hypothetical protein